MAAAQRLYDLDRSSNEFPRQLDDLLHETDYINELQNLPEGELVQLINHLNSVRCPQRKSNPTYRLPLPQILDRLDSTSDAFRKCLHVLQTICCSKQILPTTYELTGAQLARGKDPTTYGGFCNAYKGTLTEGICIKELRISSTDQEDVKKVSRLRGPLLNPRFLTNFEAVLQGGYSVETPEPPKHCTL